MAAAKKTDTVPDAAETADAVEGSADPAQTTAVEPVPADPPAGPTHLQFVGPIPLVVAEVGPCEPGEFYPVPESVAARVCAGDDPLFVRVSV